MNIAHQRLSAETIHVANSADLGASPYPDSLTVVMSAGEAQIAAEEITAWRGYAQTPLVPLGGLAKTLGIAELHYKDEGGRFGLGSFKALGGAYAVGRALAKFVSAETKSDVSATDILSGAYAEVTQRFTVTCATDGNHGRSVAWGAQRFGCACVIYVHQTVSQGRINAIASYGAHVIVHPGHYDETVRRAAEDAQASGWTVVSDTSWDGYLQIPRDVMHGYCLMCSEALAQLPQAPTHVVVPGGVGGVAAAVCAALWWHYGAERPKLIVAEPSNAACLMESAAAGLRTGLAGDIETVMAGLSCGEPSQLAWEILRLGVRDFMVVDDAMAVAAMGTLAFPHAGDTAIVAGESAACVIAALERASGTPSLATKLALDGTSRVLVFGTEGATDPTLYTKLVGASPESVRAGTAKAGGTAR
jgi:diaminopropionate ammonia-lyase